MSDAAQSPLTIEKRDNHIALVTINRPDARNAINGEVTRALEAAVDDIERDDTILVAILAGAGGKAFCAGADLKEISRGKGADLVSPRNGFAGLVYAQRTKPWIAAVDGVVLAGGCELALACDMIVASEGGAFGLPEVMRGLIASGGGVYRLPRALPKAVAMELILTGGRLPSERAAALGMVNRPVPAGQAIPAALELAAEIAANAPVAVRESLAIARVADDYDEDTLRSLSDAARQRIIGTEDYREGPGAFIEKRKPIWVGR
jgi:enoyl-CoA hydratase